MREAFTPKFGGEKLTDKAERTADWAGRAKEKITTREGKTDRALAIDDDERRLYSDELGITDRERLPEVELHKHNVPGSMDRVVRDLQPPQDPPDPHQQMLDGWVEPRRNAQGTDQTAWDPPTSNHQPADTDTPSDPYYQFEPDYQEDTNFRQVADDLALPFEDGYQDALDALDQQEAEAERERLQREAEAERERQEREAARARREREQEEREEAAWRARAARQRQQQQLINEAVNSLSQVIGTAVAPSRSRSTGSSYSSGSSTGSGYSQGGSTGSGNYKLVAVPKNCIGLPDLDFNTSSRILAESYGYWDKVCRGLRDDGKLDAEEMGLGYYGERGGSTGGGSRRTGGGSTGSWDSGVGPTRECPRGPGRCVVQ